jgi:glycosyltransferase involved in cell wall biosynthesis
MSHKPIKVLHLIASLPVGGAEELVAAVVTGLNRDRFQVQAATIGTLGAVGEELRRAGFPVISLGLDLKRNGGIRLVAAVRRLLRELKPDILHTHLYHPNLYGRLAALGLPIRGVVAEVHNAYTRTKLHRRWWNFVLSWSTQRLLVSSTQVWQDVRHFDGVSSSRLQIIPYGIRLDDLQIPLSREEAKNRLGVKGFCLGTVGRLEEQKGHASLLAALPQVCRQQPDTSLLMVGEGRKRFDLERQVQELGLAKVVRFLGTRRDLPLIYRALDIYVQPSLWEGLPLALLKAMGAGLPVVASRVSGAAEVIRDGCNGVLVPAIDVDALAAAMILLMQQPERRRELGREAQATVAAQYSQTAMLRGLEELYQELWEKGAGKKPW